MPGFVRMVATKLRARATEQDLMCWGKTQQDKVEL